MRESEKDYDNPAFNRVYMALAVREIVEENLEFVNWLNHNGFANLTCCPYCHVDDFAHVQGCKIGRAIEELYS